ncbi:putative mfs-type transporter -like isoform x2 protein [Lasius niger]|uniref:Putative mfs-type transporter-like isoform x2 protein n=1 Tax=Lasius niger TaxID=67767 RepID=A0A0J7P4S8_LASNI|nr:putative mfs-type transporter -like isoform x2 protein [Lasius niger]
MLVPNSDNICNIERGLRLMFYIVAAFTTLVLVLILFFFKSAPPLPPSTAQAVQRENTEKETFSRSIKRLLTNTGYVLLLFSYGINIAVLYAISTLLNQIILKHFQGHEEDAGRIGLTIVCTGMLSSVICGVILDKTHKFNFFITGYLPVGFEFAAELTYPEPEGTAAGLLNAVVQVFGITFTMLYGFLFNNLGDLKANIAMCIGLGIGTLLTIMIPNDLRRQNAKI